MNPTTLTTMATPSYPSLSPDQSMRIRSRSNFYTSPNTPSPYNSPRPASRAVSSTNSSRKRSREPSHAPHTYTKGNHDQNPRSPPFETPPPLAPSKYVFATGVDTPTGLANATPTEPSSERNFRRSWTPTTATNGTRNFSMTSVEANGNTRKRKRPSSPTSRRSTKAEETWTSYMTRLAKGMASQLTNYIPSWGTGNSFTSGGGVGYELSSDGAPPKQLDPSLNPTHEENSKALRSGMSNARMERDSTPVPGGFPVDDYDVVTYSSANEEDAEDERPAKRFQSQKGDWVVLNTQGRETPDRSFRRQQQSYIPRPASSVSPRAVSSTSRSSTARLSAAPQIRSTSSSLAKYQPEKQYKRSASYASPRSSPSKPSPMLYASHTSPASHNRSPSHQPPRLAKHQTTPPSSRRIADFSSPPSAEAQRFLERRQRQERLQEASMRKLNKQLKDMIKEGEAALSARAEVDDGF